MRIAYISADPGVPIFGRKGCSIHAQEVLRALLRKGAQVHLFSSRCDGEPSADFDAVLLHPLPRPVGGDAAAREQAAMAANATLRSELQRADSFDLVYERYSLWSHAGMEYAREAGVPGLLEVNAPLIEEQALYRVLADRLSAEEVADRAFGAASALLAVSDEVAAYLEGYSSARGRVRVISNGVRPERFPENQEAALPAPEGVFTVGFVGTLKAWHGLSILLEAFAKLHRHHDATRLLIVGDGPEREKLAAQAAAFGLTDAVLFTGAVPPESVPALLASMDVAVAPYPDLSQFYFSPLKVYEYMAASRPVVASRIGQLEQLIEPESNGLLVPPGHVPELAAALERLLADADLRRCLGRAGRSTVLREHTWDSVAQRILDLAAAHTPGLAMS